mmetsp:Transcript_8877/g.25329  ORF Transcript_8877/g.25329 Transcript_8877/m.25329 type:complete len:203 (+) Transcript_8877:1141-1749(+)
MSTSPSRITKKRRPTSPSSMMNSPSRNRSSTARSKSVPSCTEVKFAKRGMHSWRRASGSKLRRAPTAGGASTAAAAAAAASSSACGAACCCCEASGPVCTVPASAGDCSTPTLPRHSSSLARSNSTFFGPQAKDSTSPWLVKIFTMGNAATPSSLQNSLFSSQFSCLNSAQGYWEATCLYFGSRFLHARHQGAQNLTTTSSP